MIIVIKRFRVSAWRRTLSLRPEARRYPKPSKPIRPKLSQARRSRGRRTRVR